MATSFFFLKLLRKKCEKNNSKLEVSKTHNEICITKMKQVSKCRICFKEGSIPIFGSDSFPNISEDVMTFGDIEVSEYDELTKLCARCFALLQGAILFRKTAKEFDYLLRKNMEKVEENRTEDSSCEADYESAVNYNPTAKSGYTCKICKLNFASNTEFLVHKNSKQHRKIRIQCPICFGLLSARFYKRHMVKHKSSHLICDVCGKLYRKDNLLRHLQLHSFDLPFKCQMCPYRGRFMESLKLHMRSHTGIKPFACDQCNLRFLTRSNLNRHLLTHKKERPYKCKECSRGFYTQRDMDIHFKSDHAGIKDFACRACGNKYATKNALMKHELRVHKRNKMAKGRTPLYLQADYKE